MVVIFPTVMMGIALIIRPDMRAQVFGTGETTKKKKNSTVAGKVKAVSVENNTPVGEKESALQEVQRVANEGVVLAGNADVAVDTEEKPIQRTNPPVEREGEVRDLIYAIGIRPHQS